MRVLTFLLVMFTALPVFAVKSVQRQGTTGVMASAQVTQLASAINACWAPPLASVEGVKIYRGSGANLTKIYVDIIGTTTLTDQQILENLDAGQTVKAGKSTRLLVLGCEITGGARLTALANVVAPFWSGAMADFRWMTVLRSNGVVTVVNTIGRESISDAAAILEAASTDVVPIE
jgi:hypothetical protein